MNTDYRFEKPVEVVIEVTSKCNLDCNLCFNKAAFSERGQNEIETEDVKKIIDSIAESGIEFVRFSGGEPLLRKDIFELMEYARAKNLYVWLNTNATLITKEIAKKLEKYVENILVPLNGHNEDNDYAWTNAKGAFQKKIKGLRHLKNTSIPVIRAGTVATDNNIRNILKIYRIVKTLGLNDWELYRPIPLRKTEMHLDIETIYDVLLKIRKDYGKQILIANAIPFCYYDTKKMDELCLGAKADDGHSRLIVDPRGFSKPSYYLTKNVGNPKNIMECWNHPFMKKMRNLEFLPEECFDCIYRDKCKGGSRYAANLYFGGWSAKDPLMNPENKPKKIPINEINHEMQKQEMADKKIHLETFPRSIIIESVRGCIGNCIMCAQYVKTGRPKKISDEIIQKIEPYLKYTKELAIHRAGEAMFSDRIDYFVEQSRINNNVLFLNINPLYLNEEKTRELLKTKINAYFSVHAGSAKTFSKITGGNFDTALDNLKLFADYNKRYGNKENQLTLLFLVVKENIDEIEDFVHIAKKIDIPRIKFLRLRSHEYIERGVSRKNFKFKFSEQYNKDIIEKYTNKLPQIEQMCKELGVEIEENVMMFNSPDELKEIKKSNTLNKKRAGFCELPWGGQIQILYNGDVNLCCHTDYIIGNIYENNLKEIWNSEKMQNIRRAFAEGYFPEPCKNCKGRPKQ